MTLDAERTPWPSVPPDDGGLMTETCRGDIDTNIQSDSWLVDITTQGDFLGLCDQKSSYKHVSDFNNYGVMGIF
jgi:hypothetical protein